jgi:hypothetical protein
MKLKGDRNGEKRRRERIPDAPSGSWTMVDPHSIDWRKMLAWVPITEDMGAEGN